jgi:hypothetical protein
MASVLFCLDDVERMEEVEPAYADPQQRHPGSNGDLFFVLFNRL